MLECLLEISAHTYRLYIFKERLLLFASTRLLQRGAYSTDLFNKVKKYFTTPFLLRFAVRLPLQEGANYTVHIPTVKPLLHFNDTYFLYALISGLCVRKITVFSIKKLHSGYIQPFTTRPLFRLILPIYSSIYVFHHK